MNCERTANELRTNLDPDNSLNPRRPLQSRRSLRTMVTREVPRCTPPVSEPEPTEMGEDDASAGCHRWSISKKVKNMLESVYRADQFPSTETRRRLAAELGALTDELELG